MINQKNNESRLEYLLRVTIQLLRRDSLDQTIDYDKSTCDNFCLADDLESELDELKYEARRKNE